MMTWAQITRFNRVYVKLSDQEKALICAVLKAATAGDDPKPIIMAAAFLPKRRKQELAKIFPSRRRARS